MCSSTEIHNHTFIRGQFRDLAFQVTLDNTNANSVQNRNHGIKKKKNQMGIYSKINFKEIKVYTMNSKVRIIDTSKQKLKLDLLAVYLACLSQVI